MALLDRSPRLSSQLFKQSARLCATELASAAYQGILRREADPEGLRVYAERIESERDIVPMLRNLSSSDEHWGKLFAQHRAPLIDSLCRGLLAGAPDEALREMWAGMLTQPAELGAVAGAIAESDAHWQAQLALRAGELARAAHCAVLGAAPDAEDMNAAVLTLKSPGGLRALLELLVARLVASDELWQRLLPQRAAELARDTAIALLGADAAPAVHQTLAETLQKTGSLRQMLATLMDSGGLWRHAFAARAEALYADLHEAVLGRLPSAEESHSGGAELAASQDLRLLLQVLLGSAEYAQKLREAQEPALAALFASPAHWQAQQALHARDLLHSVHLGMLGRTPDARALASEGPKLGQPDGLRALLAQLASSDALWQRAFASRAGQLFDDLHAAVLGRQPSATERDAAVAELADSQDLRTLVEALLGSDEFAERMREQQAPALAALVSSDEHWQEQKRVHRQELVTAVYRGLLGRDPDADGLATYMAKLDRTPELLPLLKAIAGSAEHRRWLERDGVVKPAATARVPPPAAKPGPMVQAQNLAVASDIVLIEGWNAIEREGFSWSKRRSSLLVMRRTTVYLTTNVRPGAPCRIQVTGCGLTQTLEIDDAFSFVELSLDPEQPSIVHFEQLTPECRCHQDPRELAFQLRTQRPPHHYPAGPRPLPAVWQPGQARVAVFAYGSKKERDTLAPLHAALAGQGSQLLPTSAAVAFGQANANDGMVFIVASASGYAGLVNAGAEGRFVYMEHGVAPLKRYTYGAHYRRYDHLLMPGALWAERLVALYPELQGRCSVVGFPKLRANPVSPAGRQAFCERFSLDPALPVVLFAPSWSGGDRSAGIHNITWFDPGTNLLAVPHDGDFPFCDELSKQGWRIHRPGEGESISDFYACADVLVSDVSSTAIEFAALGKPALCLKNRISTDFDPIYQDENLDVAIPHTDARWDFCPVVDRAGLSAALAGVALHSDGAAPQVPALVERMCACHGDESLQRCVDALQAFLKQTGQTECSA
jgi:hypothetical protein